MFEEPNINGLPPMLYLNRMFVLGALKDQFKILYHCLPSSNQTCWSYCLCIDRKIWSRDEAFQDRKDLAASSRRHLACSFNRLISC